MLNIPQITLNNGVKIPQLGLGVFQAAQGRETYTAVRSALEVGYRHLDTATIYRNEEDVGRALRDSGVPREDVFVTTKLWNADQGAATARAAFESSLRRLGLEYLDLFLLHWPVPAKRLESWQVLESLLAEGRVRAIGVSNFMQRHLDELLAHCTVTPQVNQIELSPFLQQREVQAVCAARGIRLEAYSPLTKAQRLNHPVVVSIAQSLARSPAQVLLRWSIQHEFVVLPKSVRKERIAENAALFDFVLDELMMRQLDALEEGLVTGWDPRTAP